MSKPDVTEVHRMLVLLTRKVAVLEAAVRNAGIVVPEVTDDVDKVMHEVVTAVSERFGVPTTEILGRCREERIAIARQVSVHLVRQLSGLSSLAVGNLFARDHGTVLYSSRAVQNTADVDPVFAQTMRELTSTVQQRLVKR